MGGFSYTKEELEVNRVLKYQQELSQNLLKDPALAATRKEADDTIAAAEALLKSLGYGDAVFKEKQLVREKAKQTKLEHRPVLEDWDRILQEASQDTPAKVALEDLLTAEEIGAVLREQEEIHAEFSRRTSIVNKTDLSFLAIATGLQVAKALLFPYIAEAFGYGESFDPSERMAHNDRSIEKAHKEANDNFRDQHSENHKKGYWINLLYQTPPYDITKGSAALGINMGGAYHRMYTLGHDPILGWLFGTANILTDIVTLNNFQSYRVRRKPTMVITPSKVGLGTMLQESYETAKADYLNLPAAIFAQAQHLKSDVYTKTGLPVPILAAINEEFASSLYKNQYDALCFARDAKIVGASYLVSLFIDSIIGLVHGLFRTEEIPQRLYEARTRKILLISNALASTSTIVNSCITQNPKNLDLGSLLATITHLFMDARFLAKIKQEFIENEIQIRLQAELDEIDKLYECL